LQTDHIRRAEFKGKHMNDRFLLCGKSVEFGDFLRIWILAGLTLAFVFHPAVVFGQSTSPPAAPGLLPPTQIHNGTTADSTLPAEIQIKLDKLKEELRAARATGDARAEAIALNHVSDVYLYTSEFKKALDGYNEALTLAREAKDTQLEAAALNGLGNCDLSTSENDAAMEAYNRALAVASASGDTQGQAVALSGLGWVNNTVGKNQEALDLYRQALPLAQKASDRDLEARVLRRTGLVYYLLGDMQKALEYDKEALPIFHQTQDPYREATVLNDLGLVYSDMGEKQRALDYYTKALPIFQRVGDRESEALTWIVIGRTYGDLGKRPMELEYYKKALPIIHQVGDLDNEAKTLDGLGRVYSILGEIEKAQDYYNQALPLANTANDPIVKAGILDHMMLNQSTLQPALAIFYGKQAVNCLQLMRSDIQGLDKEVQRKFLASKDDYYHDLADLLISQGRLPEAQQVLDFLKQQEYSDYVRGSAVSTLSPLALTPAEKQAAEDYQKSTVQLVALGEQWAQLKKISSRTQEQEKQYQQLSDQVGLASRGLNDYYARLYLLFGKNSDANKQIADVKGDVSELQQTIVRMPHTVALYTMVGKDRTSIIVITGATSVAREIAISDKELNRKVADFEQVLRDPSRDPKPPAQELYKILIGTVKADLDQARAETLVWSLDGVLRYVPMAALFDGKQYLVENYNTVTITPVSISHLSEKPDVSNLSAAAMGISRKYEDGLPQLPSVVGELNDIVRDPQVLDAHGVLSGTILLNGQFTETAMERQLDSQHSVVHIASHFVFKPGDDTQSYLLLAGKDDGNAGFHLTVAEFRDDQKLSLEDTDLLTLSACETGMGGNAANGREVDGLGITAQRKGAKAVISSLWEVDDSSTGELMADFYKRWADGAGKVEKVEALRQAQLDLLRGMIAPKPDPMNPNQPSSFEHPYYWAPFVLMGNWR
jgi:CHAT domain-containing protein/Tfp pilus assembly protein PilF